MQSFIVRVVIIGDEGVGKSRLMRNLCHHMYREASTVGVDVDATSSEIDGINYKFMFYDCAGQPRFDKITRTYLSDAAVVLIVYDVCLRKTYDRALEWLSEVNTDAILVANKIDMKADREVTTLQAEACASSWGVRYSEVSAYTCENVTDLMTTIEKQLKQSLDSGAIIPSERGSGVRLASLSSINIEHVPTNPVRWECCSTQ
jgi:Ras-related protein Rab-1A